MRPLITLLIFAAAASLPPAFAQRMSNNPVANNKPVFLGGEKYHREKAPTSRSLKGTVVDIDGKPLAQALVTLTDKKTKEKRTFITKTDGRYNFGDLAFTKDYGLEARYKDSASTPRNISQYDNQANIVRILEIDTSSKSTPVAQAKK